MTDDQRPRCPTVKADGEQCGQKMNLQPDGLCLWHSPLAAETAQEARIRGGERCGEARRAKRGEVKTVTPADAPPIPETLEDAVTYAAWAVHAVATGQIDARTAREVNYGLTTFRMGLEKRDLLRQIRELRAKLTEYEKHGHGGTR